MSKITVDSVKHDAVMTNGAIIETKDRIGFDPMFEPSKIDTHAMTMLAWCSLRAAARRNNGSFDMSFEDFADRVTLREVNAWFVAENPPAETDTEKKITR